MFPVHKSKQILFFSASAPNSGKSSLLAALAAMYRNSGLKTAVLDLDGDCPEKLPAKLRILAAIQEYAQLTDVIFSRTSKSGKSFYFTNTHLISYFPATKLKRTSDINRDVSLRDFCLQLASFFDVLLINQRASKNEVAALPRLLAQSIFTRGSKATGITISEASYDSIVQLDSVLQENKDFYYYAAEKGVFVFNLNTPSDPDQPSQTELNKLLNLPRSMFFAETPLLDFESRHNRDLSQTAQLREKLNRDLAALDTLLFEPLLPQTNEHDEETYFNIYDEELRSKIFEIAEKLQQKAASALMIPTSFIQIFLEESTDNCRIRLRIADNKQLFLPVYAPISIELDTKPNIKTETDSFSTKPFFSYQLYTAYDTKPETCVIQLSPVYSFDDSKNLVPEKKIDSSSTLKMARPLYPSPILIHYLTTLPDIPTFMSALGLDPVFDANKALYAGASLPKSVYSNLTALVPSTFLLPETSSKPAFISSYSLSEKLYSAASFLSLDYSQEIPLKRQNFLSFGIRKSDKKPFISETPNSQISLVFKTPQKTSSASYESSSIGKFQIFSPEYSPQEFWTPKVSDFSIAQTEPFATLENPLKALPLEIAFESPISPLYNDKPLDNLWQTYSYNSLDFSDIYLLKPISVFSGKPDVSLSKNIAFTPYHDENPLFQEPIIAKPPSLAAPPFFYMETDIVHDLIDKAADSLDILSFPHNCSFLEKLDLSSRTALAFSNLTENNQLFKEPILLKKESLALFSSDEEKAIFQALKEKICRHKKFSSEFPLSEDLLYIPRSSVYGQIPNLFLSKRDSLSLKVTQELAETLPQSSRSCGYSVLSRISDILQPYIGLQTTLDIHEPVLASFSPLPEKPENLPLLGLQAPTLAIDKVKSESAHLKPDDLFSNTPFAYVPSLANEDFELTSPYTLFKLLSANKVAATLNTAVVNEQLQTSSTFHPPLLKASVLSESEPFNSYSYTIYLASANPRYRTFFMSLSEMEYKNLSLKEFEPQINTLPVRPWSCDPPLTKDYGMTYIAAEMPSTCNLIYPAIAENNLSFISNATDKLPLLESELSISTASYEKTLPKQKIEKLFPNIAKHSPEHPEEPSFSLIAVLKNKPELIFCDLEVNREKLSINTPSAIEVFYQNLIKELYLNTFVLLPQSKFEKEFKAKHNFLKNFKYLKQKPLKEKNEKAVAFTLSKKKNFTSRPSIKEPTSITFEQEFPDITYKELLQIMKDSNAALARIKQL